MSGAIISILVLIAIVYGIYFLGLYILNKHFESIFIKGINWLVKISNELGVKSEDK